MDTIFQKIDEIEKAASAILDGAAYQKNLLDQEHEERIRKFDEETEKKTADRVAKLRSEMHASIEDDLSSLKSSSEEKIRTMNETYETGHGYITDRICAEIIRK